MNTEKMREALLETVKEVFQVDEPALLGAIPLSTCESLFEAGAEWQASRAGGDGEAHDWSDAPKGATHYQPHQQAYYKRVSTSEWYIWSRIEDNESRRWLYSPATSDSAKWIVRPPPPAAKVPEPIRHLAAPLFTEGWNACRDAMLKLQSQPAEQPDLNGFVHWLFTSVWPHGDADGGALQEKGVEFGILRPETVTEPCGEYCGCAEWDDFPQRCYKLNVGEQQ